MDDGFGVVEPLNEEAFGTGLVVRGEHVVFLGEINELSILDEKEQALQLSLKPWTFITPLREISFDQWKENFHMQVINNKIALNFIFSLEFTIFLYKIVRKIFIHATFFEII